MTDNTVTISRSGWRHWHVQHPGTTFLGRYLGADLRQATKRLREDGYTTVYIRRGGTQRPRYEQREL